MSMPEDDCPRQQKILLSRQLSAYVLFANGFVGIRQYRSTALLFNRDVARHNWRCPRNQVKPLMLGPGDWPSFFFK
jgi:hypothetical protein